MREPRAAGYDGLSSCFVSEGRLREFLLGCFGVGGHELFVGHADRVAEDLSGTPPGVVFAVFCTYWPVRGHFAMGFEVGIAGRLAAQVRRREFFERFAAYFGSYVLYGDAEPPGLWTVTLQDGGRLRAAVEEENGRYVIYAATAPIPGLSEVRVDESLWQLR